MKATSEQDAQALAFAQQVGFRVCQDGFVQSTRASDDLSKMLVEFWHLAQQELDKDDGK